MQSTTINIVGWLLFSVMSDRTISSAQFPTVALCREGLSMVTTGRTIEDEEKYQADLKTAKVEQAKAWHELFAQAAIKECGGASSCKLDHPVSVKFGGCTLYEDGSGGCSGGGYYSPNLGVRFPEDVTVNMKKASSAHCFPIPDATK